MVLGILVLGRAVFIQRVEGQHWLKVSDDLHLKIDSLRAERGTIFSEDGEMLSTSIPYFDIYMDFGAEGLRDKNGKRFRENIDSFAYALSHFFGDRSKGEYKKDLQVAYNARNRYYLIRKGLSFDQYKSFRDFPLVRMGRNRSGIIAEVKTKRLNPYGILARRTIGLLRENAQKVGLERTYDEMLKGRDGRRLVRFIAGGAAVPVEGSQLDPENGRDVVTTLDVNIQDVVESALLKMMEQSESQYGTCLVMETKTGKIKAIANLGWNGKSGRYEENQNFALQTNEPGSTIKLATLLAVLDAGSSRVTDYVEVGSTGNAFVGVRNVTDAERAPRPVLSVEECFAHSSNVGMSKLAYKAFASNPDRFKGYLHRFHLDRPVGVGLIGEEQPRLPHWRRNKEGLHAMLTMSFGYAIEVSPFHTLMLYNAIANGGTMVRPYLVNSIQNNGIPVKTFTTEVVTNNLCKPAVVKAARRCMEAVVTEGTAKGVFADCPFPVAGKTGTAHVAGGNVKYYDGVYQASFCGYFPADKPEYSCIVVIKTKPHALAHYGGQLAAPVFKEVATKLYAMYVQRKRKNPLRLTPDSTVAAYAGYREDVKNILNTMNMRYTDSGSKGVWNVMVTRPSRPVVKAEVVKKKTIPDVHNMTLRDALYILENMDIKVVAKGRGKVVAQDILPGTPVTRNQRITLVLN
ncbi:penicillin-binding protein [Paraflavisolibacter sp. H34]|uniref:penicillin-binding protein n=1 Tax=Huijunlia imazamoxiresistens TaxID=3127457 RepID=UPI00301AB124